MKAVEKLDKILLSIYQQVGRHEDPMDHPVSVEMVSVSIQESLEQVLLLLPEVLDEGFLKCSPISDPPLLYLTRAGLARARRNTAAAA
jgi:hypothetical protein